MTGLQLTFPNASGYNHTIGGLNGTGTAISYSPAMQIASIAKSNDSFAWTSATNADRNYVTNGLNQYSSDGQVFFGYDGRGNLTSSGTQSFGYNKENQLISGPGGTTLYYDPLGRLSEYDTNVSTRFYYSGAAIAAEIANDGTGSVLRRYVMGPGTDEPIVWYEGSGTSDRRFLQADERGSIIAVTDSGGSMLGVNSYDEYGIPGLNNMGWFQYTGQTWFPEVGLYNFKARWYSPSLGRFMQTDPIGYGDGLNWHNYAHSDPVNGSDPTGLADCDPNTDPNCHPGWTVTGNKSSQATPQAAPTAGTSGGGNAPSLPPPITVTAQKPQNGPCPAVPMHPSNANVNDNIKKAKAHNTLNSSTVSTPYGPTQPDLMKGATWFYNQVKYGGPWDYKTQNPSGTQNYTNFGNFNFGATGRAVGFSESELLWGAGIAQLFHDIATGQMPKGPATRFDNADDAAPILAGIRYFDNGC